MNNDRLMEAQDRFLDQYPGGFAHPQMQEIGKKHKMEKMHEFVAGHFSKKAFADRKQVLEDMVKIVGRATMVSVFEKPAFKRFAGGLAPQDQKMLVEGLKQRLHGDEKAGFEMMCDVLRQGKMAKWTLMTIIPFYLKPSFEVFVKPTTTKGTIAHFELNNLVYKPQPTWEFYEGYRDAINEMKSKVEDSFGDNNAAFTGFLMMSMR